MMITLMEYAKRIGKKPKLLRQKCLRGGFKTAKKIGRDWFIDENEKDIDNRVKKIEYAYM